MRARRERTINGLIVACNLCEQLRRSDWLPQNKIAISASTDAWFPTRHDSDAKRRTRLARIGDELPSTAVRQTNIGDEYLVRGIRVLEQRRRFTLTRCRIHRVPVGLEQRLHELATVRMIFYEQHLPSDAMTRCIVVRLRH